MNVERLILINQIVKKIQEYKDITPPISDIRGIIRTFNGSIEINDTVGNSFIARAIHYTSHTNNKNKDNDNDKNNDNEQSFKILVTTDELNDSKIKFEIIKEIGHLFLHRGFYLEHQYRKVETKENPDLYIDFSEQEESIPVKNKFQV